MAFEKAVALNEIASCIPLRIIQLKQRHAVSYLVRLYDGVCEWPVCLGLASSVMMEKKMKDKAREQFQKLVRKEFVFITTTCYAGNIPGAFTSINEYIEAARELDVTEATAFDESEIKALVSQLSPFRVLRMNEETRAIVLPALQKHGFTLEFLEDPATPKK